MNNLFRGLTIVVFVLATLQVGAKEAESSAETSLAGAVQSIEKMDRYLLKFADLKADEKDEAERSGTFNDVISQRKQKCEAVPRACLSPDILKNSICVAKVDPAGVEIKIWLQAVAATKAVSNAEGLLRFIKGCSPVGTSRQFYFVMKVVKIAAEIGDRKTLQSAVDFIGKTWEKAPSGVGKYIELINAAKGDLEDIKPLPVDIKLKLTLISINWALTTQETDAVSKLNDLASWLSAMPGLITSTGQGAQFVSLINKYPNFLTSSSIEVQLIMLDGLCLYLRERGKVDQCEKYVTTVKAHPNLKGENAMVQIAIQEARNFHVRGQYGEASKKLETALASTGQAGLKAWMYGVLALSETCDQKFTQAKSHIKENKRLSGKTAGLGLPWLPLYGDSLELIILIENKQYAEAGTKVTEMRRTLKGMIVGNIDISAWLDYYELFLSLQKKDQVAAQKAFGTLKEDISTMPAYDVIGHLGGALVGASSGRSSAELDKAKSILGGSHCDYTRAQRLAGILAGKAQ